MAPQRDKIFKQKVNDCVQHIILQKFTNLHAIRSWNFQNICNEIGWPRFFAPPYIYKTCLIWTDIKPSGQSHQGRSSFKKDITRCNFSLKTGASALGRFASRVPRGAIVRGIQTVGGILPTLICWYCLFVCLFEIVSFKLFCFPRYEYTTAELRKMSGLN